MKDIDATQNIPLLVFHKAIWAPNHERVRAACFSGRFRAIAAERQEASDEPTKLSQLDPAR